MEKSFGKGTILNAKNDSTDIELFSSGSIGLDYALGGGYPVGRIIEIFGPESSGKTTLTIHAIVNIQQSDERDVLFIDTEHAFDIKYAEKLLVDSSRLYISQPDNGEQALNILEEGLRSKAFSLIVVDSVAALTPKSEIEGEMGEAKMGLQARLMSQAMRKIVALTQPSKTTVIFTNQIRLKIGVVYGNPETTTGGNALKFYASQRIEIRKGSQNKTGNEVDSIDAKVKVIKNKVAPPFRTADFTIIFGEGIDYLGEIVSIASELGLITKKGSWYSYNGANIGQGESKVKEFLADNADVLESIIKKVKEHETN